jgi:hypothetical protein
MNPFKQKNTVRITITIPGYIHDRMIAVSNNQGRSISNLCAFILENHLKDS